MAIDPWAIDASSGSPSYSGQEIRLLTVTPMFAGNGTALGTRSGVRLGGSGTELLVQSQTSPNMSVKVNPGAFVVQGQTSSLQGSYTWVLDTVTTLTIAASHASLDRTDLVCVRIRDSSIDTSGQRDANVIVITGTNGGGVPSLPTDATYYTLAQVSVPHGATNIGGGGGQGTITDKRTYVAALGGVIPCTSSTLPTAAQGQVVYVSDAAALSGRFRYYDGSAYQHLGGYAAFSNTSARSAVLPSPTDGMLTYRTDDRVFEVWNGSAWVLGPNPPLYVRKTADESLANSTTLQDDDHLFVSVVANAVYSVQGWILFTAGNVGDFKMGWSAPTGATFNWNAGGSVNTNLQATFFDVQDVGNTDSVGGNIGSTTRTQTATPHGLLKVSSTAGTFKFRWAQNTSEGTSLTVLTDSALMLQRVA
jgi:hypothetical protein